MVGECGRPELMVDLVGDSGSSALAVVGFLSSCTAATRNAQKVYLYSFTHSKCCTANAHPHPL